MAIVQKGNKQLKISDELVDSYLAQGYSQLDDKGNVKKKATGGFNPSIADLQSKDAEIASLQNELEKLKKK